MGHIMSKAQPGADDAINDASIKISQGGPQRHASSVEAAVERHDDDEHKQLELHHTASIAGEFAALRKKGMEVMLRDMEQLFSRIEEMHEAMHQCASQIAQQDATLSDLFAQANALQDLINACAPSSLMQPVSETKHESNDNEQPSHTTATIIPSDIVRSPDNPLLKRLCAIETAVASLKSMTEGTPWHYGSEKAVAPDAVLAPPCSSLLGEGLLPLDWEDNPDNNAKTTSPARRTTSAQMQPPCILSNKAKSSTLPSLTVASSPPFVQKPRQSLFGNHNLSREPGRQSGHDGGSNVRSLPVKRKAVDEGVLPRHTKEFATVLTSDCVLVSGMLQATKAPILRRSGRESKPNPLRVRPNDTQLLTSDSITELPMPASSQLDYGALHHGGR